MYSNRTEKLLLMVAACAAGLLGCLTVADYCGFA